MLGGNLLPEGSESIAQAYAGHQFGHFTILGDGRAIIIGEQEKSDKTVQVKNLNDGSQQTIEQKNIFEHFKSLTL